ncbi:MdtA/MuxA family multidrug efflux RND transporter periplasmic adaptor subunit [Pseudomonas sp. E141]|jgi:multidrug efflux system membrane fusion protein|uniref:MdtA/MuxA family multidrug efflux RND transporter periplasmic adaptor subunit n=1 Tax=Pseudomonas TaxID=286 RepID=UPI0006405E1F|nr:MULTISPECIES: MdtA/MuxA family multidrug efflux RND transporter periplasmic adaptor subunit [Pseudomonas]MBD0704242.1 multidrug transporter subunit MdtA [Pseudomonas sp. PSB1]MDD2034677.1 MdtA/MuxA family multidrug efflux RND transporter periplasmic adaptor subunit [Pseudomonas sp. 39167]MDR8389105.1 MdtA/MuxA family multidrug efflux RND transporter periplasmic adaptor subunit [Pseudomonas sp. JL2]MXR30576.1 MdtA/MuxA family multidrug efflux RND transporter periplasmic adaptor subunit [Pseud
MVDHSMQSSVSHKSRRWLFGLVVVLIVAALAWKFWPAGTDQKPGAGQKAPAEQAGRSGGMRPGFGGATGPVPVRVAPAVTGDFPLYYKALGTVTALNTINVRSRVGGELVKIAFEEGQMVKAGDLLAEIDPRPYQNALLQAEGTLLQNQAQLKNAQVDLERYRGLYAEDSIAKQTLDTAAALVGQYQGTVKTNQAAVNDAKLNLEFTRIRAPISGRVGLRQLDVGNLVAANDTTALAVITQTQPISVVFTLPETNLDTVLARYRSGAKLPVEAWDRSDLKLQASGVLQSLDNQIDITTGTLKFKARYDNRDQSLFPNQFVNVHLLADTLKNVVLAPTAAIQFGTNGTFVYALDGDKKVTIRKLKIGASDGEHTVVTEGLAAGDRVVLEGTDRLKEGSEVDVVNDSQDVPTTPTEHLQGKTAAAPAEPAVADKAKKGGA